ncbi:50S ribosomal protein L36 [Candidatus Hodgkinia cicadicola]|uniref:50S ribosomal protein L36 n=1 Tax=Candidatus Hodgkinia cicadicola TaxID=573658 RepID=A0ABX4MFI8_9HYPH|nr:MAG: 50S ribosomal protein L36 [Candidatus Hodgkinia cicadicola]PIM95336.1 50S ribosomal protein L36 [Candidatus Hodgkinia cicadicola]PIM95430.1 50S ribosomal protein L36 [Candidatus Hodgkinia cicadicola]PIM96732.1 50S ribosomal protein L36 [Candidatus Hodgkinia cicadicola]
MKLRTSLRSLKRRNNCNLLIKRRGKMFIVNKKFPRFKARQK